MIGDSVSRTGATVRPIEHAVSTTSRTLAIGCDRPARSDPAE